MFRGRLEIRVVGGAEVELPVIDHRLVRRLVDSQFPQWAALPLRLLDPAGSDHVIYRMGDELALRLPRHPGPVLAARKESKWLSELARHLPLPIPVQVAVGEPAFGYPWPWSVARWLPGRVAADVPELADSANTALDLAEFLTTLQRFAPAELPTDDITLDLTTERPLSGRDQRTGAAIDQVKDTFPAAALTELWEAALAAPAWDRAPVWFHGDFHAGNLLAADGRITAVIDFGALGIGDPACDIAVAFGFMSPRIRNHFRATLGVDDATWTRARGWALAGGLIAYSSYGAANPRLAQRTTRQVLDALDG